MKIPSATQLMIPQQVSPKRVDSKPQVIERADENRTKREPAKQAVQQLPEVTPEQVEVVLSQATELIPSSQGSSANAEADFFFNQQAINAYQVQTDDDRKDFVRSVVAGIDVFV